MLQLLKIKVMSLIRADVIRKSDFEQHGLPGLEPGRLLAILTGHLKRKGVILTRDFVAAVITLCDNNGIRLHTFFRAIGIDPDDLDDATAKSLAEASMAVYQGLSDWLQHRRGSNPTPVFQGSRGSYISEILGMGPGARVHLIPSKTYITKRSGTAAMKARKRDNDACILTHSAGCLEACHIIPYSVAKTQGDKVESAFWKFLKAYLPEEDYNRVIDFIFGVSSDDMNRTNINRLENLICLDSSVHHRFNEGWITLHPIEGTFTPSSYSVRLEFITSRRPVENLEKGTNSVGFPWRIGEHLNVQDDPTLQGFAFFDLKSQALLKDGMAIEISTPDPVQLPLPSPGLLRLHAAISRIVRMAGRSIDDTLFGFEDVDDDES
ncbi:hypothetical protein ABW21_db0200811 [Orbilia brochopaga]|nr:hypothetical protein ABW21_db0200811 [Drechslerella brochopaga]